MDIQDPVELAESKLNAQKKRNTYRRLMRLKREYRARNVVRAEPTCSTSIIPTQELKSILYQLCVISVDRLKSLKPK